MGQGNRLLLGAAAAPAVLQSGECSFSLLFSRIITFLSTVEFCFSRIVSGTKDKIFNYLLRHSLLEYVVCFRKRLLGIHKFLRVQNAEELQQTYLLLLHVLPSLAHNVEPDSGYTLFLASSLPPLT